MADLAFLDITTEPAATGAIDPACLDLRRANFPNQITFHTPGLKRYKTSEYAQQDAAEFVAISLTGAACALSCEHCKMNVLNGMADLRQVDGSLFDLCAGLAEQGA